ncbi:MAG: hypothetical protein ABH832_00345 [bacterium]
MHKIILKNLSVIFIWGIIFATLSLALTVFLPKQYSAESKVLIISKDRSGVDPYTQAKSAERIGENLAQIMMTSDFFDKVVESKLYSLSDKQWSNLSERQKRKKWKKDVQATVIYGTSIMNIKTFAADKNSAVSLSKAVSQTLASRGWEYAGGDIALKVVNSPIASVMPARPNYAMNAVLAFILGVLTSIIWFANYRKHHLFQ